MPAPGPAVRVWVEESSGEGPGLRTRERVRCGKQGRDGQASGDGRVCALGVIDDRGAGRAQAHGGVRGQVVGCAVVGCPVACCAVGGCPAGQPSERTGSRGAPFSAATGGAPFRRPAGKSARWPAPRRAAASGARSPCHSRGGSGSKRSRRTRRGAAGYAPGTWCARGQRRGPSRAAPPGGRPGCSAGPPGG